LAVGVVASRGLVLGAMGVGSAFTTGGVAVGASTGAGTALSLTGTGIGTGAASVITWSI
jgi:hypothetical protein